ncbi:hypothetical protein CR513_44617, partial [Mucuna pruriens]
MFLKLRNNLIYKIIRHRVDMIRKLTFEVVEGYKYSAELMTRNLENTCNIQLAKLLLYVRPKPFIGVDGCHLKTKYEGQLLIVVGRDEID